MCFTGFSIYAVVDGIFKTGPAAHWLPGLFVQRFSDRLFLISWSKDACQKVADTQERDKILSVLPPFVFLHLESIWLILNWPRKDDLFFNNFGSYCVVIQRVLLRLGTVVPYFTCSDTSLQFDSAVIKSIMFSVNTIVSLRFDSSPPSHVGNSGRTTAQLQVSK